MRVPAFLVSLVLLVLIPAVSASATPPETITIDTYRERGSPGTFSLSGVITDSGTFTTANLVFSGIGAPNFLIIHATYEFVGSLGTFILRTQITETLTADPNVLTGNGNWVILSGTGAYEGLNAQGEITGVTDENLEPDVFIRLYTGKAHSD